MGGHGWKWGRLRWESHKPPGRYRVPAGDYWAFQTGACQCVFCIKWPCVLEMGVSSLRKEVWGPHPCERGAGVGRRRICLALLRPAGKTASSEQQSRLLAQLPAGPRAKGKGSVETVHFCNLCNFPMFVMSCVTSGLSPQTD